MEAAFLASWQHLTFPDPCTSHRGDSVSRLWLLASLAVPLTPLPALAAETADDLCIAQIRSHLALQLAQRSQNHSEPV